MIDPIDHHCGDIIAHRKECCHERFRKFGPHVACILINFAFDNIDVPEHERSYRSIPHPGRLARTLQWKTVLQSQNRKVRPLANQDDLGETGKHRRNYGVPILDENGNAILDENGNEILSEGGRLALLCNTTPTGAILVVLILVFGPLSGAHFNPAVILAYTLRRELSWSVAVVYVAAQVIGAVTGVWAAHLMFELPLWQFSTTARVGAGQWVAEAVATFGLMLTILGCTAKTPPATLYAVGLYITSAYWFTASTSFANPAVTIALSPIRSLA